MTTLEQLPERIETVVTLIDTLGQRVEDLNREQSDRMDRRLGDLTRELNGRIDERSNEVMNHARALHEDVINRIKIVGEGDGRRRR